MSEQNITELLHPAFLARMREMLGDEYDSFTEAMIYQEPTVFASTLPRSAARNLKNSFRSR